MSKRCYFLWGLTAMALSLPAAHSYAADLRWITPTSEELAMTAEPKAPGAPAIYLSYEEMDDADSAEVTLHLRIKVLTEGGIQAGTIDLPDRIVENDSFPIDLMARTIHSNGAIIPFIGKPHVLPDEGKQVVSMPDVQVGSILELICHFHSQETMLTRLVNYYTPTWRIQREYFLRSGHFTLHVPEDLDSEVLHWTTNLPAGVVPRRLKNQIELDVTNVPEMPQEELMPPKSVVASSVRFFVYRGTKEKYWGESGDRVDTAWSNFYEPKKSLMIAVHDLYQPGDNDEQKLRKIYAAIMQMENTDFTRERQKVEDKKSGFREAKNSDDIWQRKRGDSQELTLLFIAMARAAGFKAYPMAVTSRDRGVFSMDVLSWGQTDSMVAIVVLNGQESFFDPGERLCVFGGLAPNHSNVAGVSIEGKLIKFLYTPAATNANAVKERRAELTLAADGSVTGTIQISWSPRAALGLRQQGLREDRQEVEKDLEESLQKEVPDGVEVKLTSLEPLDNGQVPLVMNLAVSGRLGNGTEKRWIVPSQFFVSKEPPTLAPSTRTQPVEFPLAYTVRDAVLLHLPDTLTVESLPKNETASFKEKDAAYLAHSESGPNGTERKPAILMRRILALNRIDYPVAEYGDLHSFFGAVATRDQQQLILSTKVSGNMK